MELIKKIFKYINKAYIAGAIAAALLSNIFAIFAPVLIGRSIDFALEAGNVDFGNIINLILQLGVVYIVSALSGYLVSLLAAVASSRAINLIRRDAFQKLGEMPLSFFDRHPHGDIMSKLSNDADVVGEGLFQLLSQLFTGLTLIVAIIVFMFGLSPVITLVVLVVTPFSILLSSVIVKRSNSKFMEQSKTVGELNGYVLEIIGNQKITTAFNYQGRALEHFEEINNRLYNCGQKSMFYSSLTNPGTRFINHIAYILVGVAAGFTGQLSIGGISVFLSYATQLARPINDITGITVQLQAAMASAARIFTLLESETEEMSRINMELNVDNGHVEFKNITFGYHSRQQAEPAFNSDVTQRNMVAEAGKSRANSYSIKNLSLNIKPGTITAIVGPTGAGKTTLVNLLMRFYDPLEGKILIDDTDISDVSRDSLRRSFGMVLQETWLFSGTIRDNISYANPGASFEEIKKAAKASHAHSFIRRLPDGYNSVITEQGSNLSQGQKQLLTIARAMLAAPPMLILDEATSSVDILTEQQIQKAFLRMMKGRTSFVIAHRLSTIRDADLILVMDKGDIVEKGTHTELINNQGLYASLYNSNTT